MTTLDALLLIGEIAVLLYLLWRMLQFVFDAIDQYHAAWREEREREAMFPDGERGD